MSNKSTLRAAIIAGLEADLETARQAANTARDTAISKESVAENKYDTFGLEASYLAHGQSQRVLQLAEDIEQYRSLVFKEFSADDPIDLTSVVSLEDQNAQCQHFFIGPAGGGMKLTWNQMELRVVTPATPMGQNLMGKLLEDEVLLKQGATTAVYEIVAIY